MNVSRPTRTSKNPWKPVSRQVSGIAPALVAVALNVHVRVSDRPAGSRLYWNSASPPVPLWMVCVVPGPSPDHVPVLPVAVTTTPKTGSACASSMPAARTARNRRRMGCDPNAGLSPRDLATLAA